MRPPATRNRQHFYLKRLRMVPMSAGREHALCHWDDGTVTRVADPDFLPTLRGALHSGVRLLKMGVPVSDGDKEA